jgi:hypothetical protein
MPGFGAVSEFAIGEFFAGGEVVVDFIAATIVFDTDLIALSGATVGFDAADITIAADLEARAGASIAFSAGAVVFDGDTEARAGASVGFTAAVVVFAAEVETVAVGASVVFTAETFSILAAMTVATGARVEIVNFDPHYHGGSIGELAIGEIEAPHEHPGAVISFLGPTLDVVNRTKRPTFQVIES